MLSLSILSFIVLAVYLYVTAKKYGVANMVSDTYYQLGKKKRLFSVVMSFVAIAMLICLLDTEQGIQCLAFLGCGGLLFVGAAPNYIDADEYKVHKIGAIIASIGCVGWCISAFAPITLIITTIYAAYIYKIHSTKANHGESANNKDKPQVYHPWYWAEVSAFLDVFLTYLTIVI